MIPFSVKLFYTLFVCLLVPVYWRHYGLANFLWFSDLALLIGLAATWLESPLLASMQAVSVLLLELIWIIDFLVRLATGKPIIGIAEYMFRSDKPLFVRCLSLFHLVLPVFLAWLVYVLGYDSRAWILQTFLFWTVVLVCYYFTKPSDNINWVFGIGSQPQQKISPSLYLALLMLALPICVYLPTHLFLAAVMPEANVLETLVTELKFYLRQSGESNKCFTLISLFCEPVYAPGVLIGTVGAPNNFR